MRVVLISTGTELLLGDVRDVHLSFIARTILPLGLRVEEQRIVADGEAIRHALTDLLSLSDLIFVTGGLGPTTDDITREMIAGALGLKLRHDDTVMAAITERFTTRGIKFTDRISRQAQVPEGARVLPNENGTAPGFYLDRNIKQAVVSPHLFVLPGPPRELQPMFQKYVVPILQEIAPATSTTQRMYRVAGLGESLVEKAIGEKVHSVGGLELGYCARPGEVDVRVVGDAGPVAEADQIIRGELGSAIFSTTGESMEEVLIKLLASSGQTLALAESCTGGWLVHRLTNVPGSSEVVLAGYVTYANRAKVDVLDVDPALIQEHGAVSREVARAMAEGARARAQSTFGISTTGIAGPGGGSDAKPVGTVHVGLAGPNGTHARKLFYPSDRPTFKDVVAQTTFDWLRRELIRPRSS